MMSQILYTYIRSKLVITFDPPSFVVNAKRVAPFRTSPEHLIVVHELPTLLLRVQPPSETTSVT